MTTIEKAREYARNGVSLCMDTSDEQDIYCEDLIQAYLAGAQSEREELTRWNDPNKPPTDEMRVIAKVVLLNGATLVTGAWYAVNEFPTGWSVDLDRTFENLHVLGWRPIYENK